jgi:D-alanyl-D-alanine carboxypeptidase
MCAKLVTVVPAARQLAIRLCFRLGVAAASLVSCSTNATPPRVVFENAAHGPSASPAGASSGGAAGFAGENGVRSRVEQAVDAVLARHAFAGVSVALQWRAESVEIARGFADVENASPAATDTVYPIGSVTKQFTASAVLQLVEKGEVALDAPLNRYLPRLPAAWSGVRVRHVLNHTSGIPSYTKAGERWQALAPFENGTEKLLALVADRALEFEPGTRFSYGNTGYLLLGLLIEAVTGQSYDAYLRQFVLRPAVLEKTFPCPPRRLVPKRAHGYAIEHGVLVRARYLAISNAFASGDLCSTAADVVRWQRALWSGRVSSTASIRSMTTSDVLVDGARIQYGLGIGVSSQRGHSVWFHGGRIPGYTSQVTHYPDDDLTIAVLTNSENQVAREVETAAAAALLGFDAIRPDMFFD